MCVSGEEYLDNIQYYIYNALGQRTSGMRVPLLEHGRGLCVMSGRNSPNWRPAPKLGRPPCLTRARMTTLRPTSCCKVSCRRPAMAAATSNRAWAWALGATCVHPHAYEPLGATGFSISSSRSPLRLVCCCRPTLANAWERSDRLQPPGHRGVQT